MEQVNIKFQRSFGDWLGLFLFQLLSLPFFRLFYLQITGKNWDDSIFLVVGFLVMAFAFLLFASYRMFLIPYAIQFQNDGFLIIKSVFLKKTMALHEVQSIRITPFIGNRIIFYIIFKNGEVVRVPPLFQRAGLIKKLTLLYPQIEIKIDRSL